MAARVYISFSLSFFVSLSFPPRVYIYPRLRQRLDTVIFLIIVVVIFVVVVVVVVVALSFAESRRELARDKCETLKRKKNKRTGERGVRERARARMQNATAMRTYVIQRRV